MRQWLRDIRHQKGLTGKQVGALCGIRENTYCMIETGLRGKPLKVDLAKAIGKALDFDWKRFYDDVEPRASFKSS